MRKFIFDLLKNTQIVDYTIFKENINTYFIKKYEKPAFDLGKCYIIELDKSIVNNKSSVIATNWNHGTAPQNQYLKIYVSKILGKMIYIDSLAFDINTNTDLSNMWSGWLNTSELTQIAAL